MKVVLKDESGFLKDESGIDPKSSKEHSSARS